MKVRNNEKEWEIHKHRLAEKRHARNKIAKQTRKEQRRKKA